MINQIAAFFSLLCIGCGLSLVYFADSESVGFVLGGAIVLAVGLVVLFFVLKDWLKWRRASREAWMKPGTTPLFSLSRLRAAAPEDASPAKHALAAHNISFSGPFLTPRGKSVFVVEGGVLLESEIMTLANSGDLTPDGIRKFIRQLRDSGKLS